VVDIFGTNKDIRLNFDTVACFLLKEKEERHIDEICKEAMELEFWITKEMSDLSFIINKNWRQRKWS